MQPSLQNAKKPNHKVTSPKKPKTQVQLNAIKFSSIHLIGPNEIQFTLAAPTNMSGQKIQVVNPDGSQDTYFSYLRGIPFGASNRPLLANAVPIFSAVTHSLAVFNPVAGNRTYITDLSVARRAIAGCANAS